MPNPSSSPEHNRLIRATIAELERQGFGDISADHIPGYPTPENLNGSRPDVTAKKSSARLIAECETSDGLALAHTDAQWKELFSYAQHCGGYFVAVVAKPDEAAAQQLLAQVAGKSNQAFVWSF